MSEYLPACSWGICLGTWTEYNLRVTSQDRGLQRSAGGIVQQTDLKRRRGRKRRDKKGGVN
jgi:hypothetical protein